MPRNSSQPLAPWRALGNARQPISFSELGSHYGPDTTNAFDTNPFFLEAHPQIDCYFLRHECQYRHPCAPFDFAPAPHRASSPPTYHGGRATEELHYFYTTRGEHHLARLPVQRDDRRLRGWVNRRLQSKLFRHRPPDNCGRQESQLSV